MQQNSDSVAGQTARPPVAPISKEKSLIRRCAILITALLVTAPLGAKQSNQPMPAKTSLPTMDRKAEVKDPINSTRMATLAKRVGSIAKNKRPYLTAQQQLSDYATQELNSQTEEFLNRWGTAQIKFSGDEKFKRFSGEAALLYPFQVLEKQSISFTELRLQYLAGDPIANLGLGQRYWVDNWLLGGNLFFDWNTKQSHYRLGVGGEAWSDYLLLSANGYFPLSKWKNINDNKDREKPSSGFDIRAHSYLPQYPQLGGKLLFEQYFGTDVPLLAKDKRQKDPFAVGIGIDYTPFPLLTVGADFRLGKKNKSSTKFNLQLQYALSTPWQHQLESERVANMRTISFSQFDFVQRNNQIVMQREKRKSSSEEKDKLLFWAPDSLLLVKGEKKSVPFQVSVPQMPRAAIETKLTVKNQQEFETKYGKIELGEAGNDLLAITYSKSPDGDKEDYKTFTLEAEATVYLAGTKTVVANTPVTKLNLVLVDKKPEVTLKIADDSKEIAAKPSEEIALTVGLDGSAAQVKQLLFTWFRLQGGTVDKRTQTINKAPNGEYVLTAPKEDGVYNLYVQALGAKSVVVSDQESIDVVVSDQKLGILSESSLLVGNAGDGIETTLRVLTAWGEDSYALGFSRSSLIKEGKGDVQQKSKRTKSKTKPRSDTFVTFEEELQITLPKKAGTY